MKPMSHYEVPAEFWHLVVNDEALEDKALKGKAGKDKIQCDLCPRFCHLSDGQRGLCFVRERRQDQLILNSYGRSSGFCIDPIEKKPLYHYYPGSPVLSFGTAGCNLACKFCQNWDISKSRQVNSMASSAQPRQLAEAALQSGCEHIAFTYNDPVIFFEYARDTALACRELGINTVAVTAGYITEQARPAFFEFIDAANIDLKAFNEDFYYRLCGGQLQSVLETIEYVHQETDVWLELTTLLIPGHNDSEAEIRQLAEWVLEHLGPQVPLHFSAFHPDWKMRNVAPTPPATLHRARQLALQTGLQHVYTGNIRDREGGTSYCHHCGQALIVRDAYEIEAWHLDREGACANCGSPLPGFFHGTAGQWGNRRQVLQFNN